MWTICWVNANGEDKWDRLDRDGVMEKLGELREELGGIEDVLVFKPDTEVNISDVFGIDE